MSVCLLSPSSNLSFLPYFIPVINQDIAIGCPQHHMLIIIRKNILSKNDMRKQDISLNDPSCLAKDLNGTHYVLESPIKKCGTEFYKAKNAFVYKNTVRERYHGNGLISRLHEVRIPFKCYYAVMGSTSAISLNATRKKISMKASDKEGDLNLGLSVFKDIDYHKPYGDQDFPVGVSVSQRIFMQLEVASPDKRLTVAAHRCHATPDQNANNSIFYDIIAEG